MFAPFLTKLSTQKPDAGAHPVVLITDIAKAAYAAQLIITYFVIFSLVTLDVYEQYPGMLVVEDGRVHASGGKPL